MNIGLIIILFLGLVLGGILATIGVIFAKQQNQEERLIAKIDEILPQTQCAQCGYPGCKPYATAIAKGEADINLCPPGGEETIQNLAHLLNVEVKSLAKEQDEKKVAFIIEDDCIGCTLCIKACPVDAITGTNKFMHTIIAQECTGCELCVPVCPTDCIKMIQLVKNI